MRITENRNLRMTAGLAAVALLACALGIAASAHMTRLGQGAGQGPRGQGGPPPGMMGQGPGGRGGSGGPGGGILGMIGPELRALDLTDAQQKQVQAVLDSHRDEQKAIRDRMQAARKALNDAIAADTFDETAIRAKAADVAAVEADSAVLQAKVRAAVCALLTPEQLQKLKELRSRMENRPARGPGRTQTESEPRPEPRSENGPSLPETV